MRALSKLVSLAGLAGLAACGSAPVDARGPVPPADAKSSAPAEARWIVTAGYSLALEPEAQPRPRDGSTARPEAPKKPVPALANGKRVILDAGRVAEFRDDDVALKGFRSVPARLGGGFLLWSTGATFRASEFLGPLERVADVAPTLGTRTALDAVWLRSEQGVFALKLGPGAPSVTRVTSPAFADTAAVDAKRAVRIDALGRPSFTVDGGATWASALEVVGYPASVGDSRGEVFLSGASGSRRLLPADAAPDRDALSSEKTPVPRQLLTDRANVSPTADPAPRDETWGAYMLGDAMRGIL